MMMAFLTSFKTGSGRLQPAVLAAFVATVCCASLFIVTPQAQQPELIVRNGLIVTPAGRVLGDLRIRGEQIAEIGQRLTAGPGAREIDARNMLVIPGGVDPHTHLVAELPNPPRPNANQD